MEARFTKAHVSVPLRGKGRDQQALQTGRPHRYVEFPSPCGEKVGINSNKLTSPTSTQDFSWVSVPLRGKGRDQQGYDGWLNLANFALVSVPLRGKGRDQLLKHTLRK